MRATHRMALSLCVGLCALGIATASVQAEPEPVPETPSRQSVVDAMTPLYAAISECGARSGVHGAVTIRFVFDSSGAVTELTIPPEHASTQLGLCFRDTARAARVPPFRRPQFTVSFPFRF